MTVSAHRSGAPSSLAAADFLQPGRNCWRVVRSPRSRVIQDAADYFALARTAILHAEHSVFLLGWDILAGLDLLPGSEPDGAPTHLAQLLAFVTRRRPGLQCHVLVWDHASLYALERDPFTRLRFGWLAKRVHFRFDDQVPMGASLHDKVLVVDDAIAFAGSIDLTTHRWDTVAHALDEPRRKTALGSAYGPYHDVQLMVQGAAANALGEHARERWRRLRWRRLPPVRPIASAIDWLPPDPTDLHDATIAIARTRPPFGGYVGHRECAALMFDGIAAARDWIYLENQYFTDPNIADALAARLREAHGPEVVVVCPLQCSGWLENQTMGVMRAGVFATLRRADLHGRLRLLAPMASRAADVATFVHSKVMAVDGEVLRVGSANLARRSMGMDCECDLAVHTGGDAAVRAGIEAAFSRLLAEHLGADPQLVRATLDRQQSLVRTIDALSGGDRTLVAQPDAPDPGPDVDSLRDLADPAEPMALVTNFANALPELEAGTERRLRIARCLPVLVVALAAPAVWRTADVAMARSLDGLGELLTSAPQSPSVLLGTVSAFVVAGLTFVPLRVLMVAAAIVIGPWLGGAAAIVGTAIAVAAGHAIGGAIGAQRLARWIGARAYRLLRLLHRPELLAIAMMRLVPVSSSTTMNLLCGVAGVPWRQYLLGTALGLLLPIASGCMVGGLWRRAIVQHEPWTAVFATGLALLFLLAGLRLRRRLLRQHADRALSQYGERRDFG